MSLKMLIQTIPYLLLAIVAIVVLIPACAPNFNSAGRVKEYKTVLTKTKDASPKQGIARRLHHISPENRR